jgi:hypothetical protein
MQQQVESYEFTTRLQLTKMLRDSSTATHRLLEAWTEVPLLMMLNVDWEQGPLVLIGIEDLMMWPLLPPGSLLQLNPKQRKVLEGKWSEFERPVYLVEYEGKFYCCYAQRKGEQLLLISHNESPIRRITSIPSKEARVRGQLKTIFRALATRDMPAGRPTKRSGD